MMCFSFVEAEAQTVPDFIPEEGQSDTPQAPIVGMNYAGVESDILKGNFDRARAALSEILAADPHSFQAVFLLAEVERRSGNLEAAITLYREILAGDPELDRVRLELAVTLIAASRDAEAQNELFHVLRNTPPGVVASRIRNVLGAIELRRPFVWDAGVSLVGDTNANAAPPDRVVTILGLPFVLSDENQQRSGVGLNAYLAGEWRPELTEDLRLRLGASLSGVGYQGRVFDSEAAGGQLGLQLLRERWAASVLIVGSARAYGGEPYSLSYGLRTEGVWSPVERVALGLNGEFQYTSNATLGAVSGNQWSIGAVPAYAFRPHLTGWLTLGYGERDSRSSVFAYRSERVGLGGRIDTDWGITASAEADAIFYQYGAPNPLFGLTQRDTLAWGYVALAAPRFSVLGLVPRIALTYSNNFSNIPIYRYERTNLEFSFVRRF
jgi:hypothetical protein